VIINKQNYPFYRQQTPFKKQTLASCDAAHPKEQNGRVLSPASGAAPVCMLLILIFTVPSTDLP